MKTKLIIFAGFICLTIAVFCQPPQSFNYQAVVRNSAGEIIPNQPVGIRINIRNTSASGTIVYQESHSQTTNALGILSLSVGSGTPTGGAFSAIDWRNNAKFIEILIDPVGGTNYISMGSVEILSVPYSLFSKSSEDSYWKINGTNMLYYTNGFVGIGTNNPAKRLHVNGFGLFRENNGGVLIGNDGETGTLGWAGQTSTYSNILLNYGKTTVNGYFGIGLINPETNLVVKSSGYTHGMYIYSSDNQPLFRIGQNTDESGSLYVYDGNGINTVYLGSTNNSFINGGALGLGTSSPSNARLQVEGPGTYDGFIRIINTGEFGASFFMGSTNSTWGSGGSNQNKFFMGHGVPSSANADLVIAFNGNVGIGTTSPAHKVHIVETSTVASGLVAQTSAGDGVAGISTGGVGIYGASTYNHAGYFAGNVVVAGVLSKGAGSFVIDHPLDPENKILRHNFVESPENLLIYRGTVALDARGFATIILPDYFKALAKEDEASIHVTAVGKPFLTGAEWNTDYSSFMIYGDSNRKVFWEVLAGRDDPVIHELGRPVEEEKGENAMCEKGMLLFPKAYGYPETRSRDYEYLSKIRNNNQ
ncbi:MAG: hypothetical protein ACNA7V_13130 [Bacteroidales bacterium]